MKHAIVFFLFSMLFLSCQQPIDASYIVFPAEGSVWLESNAVQLMASHGNSIRWFANDELIADNINEFQHSFKPGTYTISLFTRKVQTDTIQITVVADSMAIGEARKYLFPGYTGELALPPGAYNSSLVQGESAYPLEFSCSTASIPRSIGQNNSQANRTSENSVIIKDSGFRYGGESLPVPAQADRVLKNRYLLNFDLALNDVRNFRMANPQLGIMQPGWDVDAQLVFLSDGLQVWLDTAYVVDQSLLSALFPVFAELAYPRARALLGPAEDLDNNQSLTVLMSGRLNDQGSAIGFFNPYDFFEYNNNPASPDYNPTSNGMDILYMGVPSADPENLSYCNGSLAATLCHEYQHLVHFSRKTWSAIKAGIAEPPYEELFLDEGLSHLVESICGFGLQGGNLLFIERFSQNPGYYSLSSRDLGGGTDTPGRRGAVAAFLWYVYQARGGAHWDTASPTTLVDLGGVVFLNAILASKNVGWSAIEAAVGGSAYSWLKDWGSYTQKVLGGLATAPIPLYDSVTGDPITLSLFEGIYTYGSRTISLLGPIQEDSSESMSMPPWSVRWMRTVEYSDSKQFIISTASAIQNAEWLFLRVK